MSNIDPTDVYPARNLPGVAEQWGRRVQDDQVALKRNAVATDQSIQAMNRSTASSFAQLSQQLKALPTIESDTYTSTNFGLAGVISLSNALYFNPAPGLVDSITIQTTAFANAIRTTTPTTARLRGYLRFEITGYGFFETPVVIAPNQDTQHTLNLSGSVSWPGLSEYDWTDPFTPPVAYATVSIFSDSGTAFGTHPDNYLNIFSTAIIKNKEVF